MKIAYFFTWNDDPRSGVMKKVQDQVSFWKKSDNEIEVFILTSLNSQLHTHFSELQNSPGITWHCLANTNLAERLRQTERLFKEISQYEPDIVYMRKSKYSPGIHRILKNHPSVMELNGKPKPFKWHPGSIYDLLTFKKLLKDTNGFISVGKEIAETPLYANCRKPTKIIGNSIDQSQFEILPPSKNPDLTFVYIGSPGQHWQGVDKILSLSRKRPSWSFHIIGSRPEEFGPGMDTLPNVLFHGKLNKEDYLQIFKKSDIAFGSLARHRRGMNETSTLKMREYLTCGLPVITGHKDPDFTGKEPYILELPNYEDNVVDHIEQIESFAKKWKGRRVDRKLVEHLDVRFKEKERLAFFARIASI